MVMGFVGTFKPLHIAFSGHSLTQGGARPEILIVTYTFFQPLVPCKVGFITGNF